MDASMQRAGLSLLQDIKHVPLIHSYRSIQSLTKNIKKTERKHDLVIASFVLGEIPSMKDQIAIVCQLWGLTRDMLRSGGAALRGFEDEKFSFVVFRRGERPQEPWPLDGIKFETLKELHAKRKPEDLEIDFEDESELETDETVLSEVHLLHDSEATESDAVTEYEDEEEKQQASADLGTGWGRIIFMPQKRGKRIAMDVCRATKRDGSEGSFEHLVISKGTNPTLHHQARKSLWGDLWPY